MFAIRLWAFYAVFSFCLLPAQSGILHVKSGGTGDGSSWTSPFGTIQAAINAGVAGDEVWVAAGTYPEILTLKSGSRLYGGFAGNETERGSRTPTSIVTAKDYYQEAVVTIPSGAGPDTVVDGFTVTAPQNRPIGIQMTDASPTISNNIIRLCAGGGIVITGGSPSIIGNTISSNTGHGILATASATVIRGNHITENSGAGSGGGVSISGGASGLSVPAPIISDNAFDGNHALSTRWPWSGGGLYVEGPFSGSVMVIGNTFALNTCAYNGGGMSVANALVTVSRNTFDHNVAGNGGGAYVWGDGSVDHNVFTNNSTTQLDDPPGGMGAGISANGMRVQDNLFAGNQTYDPQRFATIHGGSIVANNTVVGNNAGGIELVAVAVNNIVTGSSFGISPGYPNGGYLPPSYTVSHNNVWGNSVNYVSIPDPAGTNGNISVDPQFINKSSGDYHLFEGSFCIDTGDDAYVQTGDTDLDGKPRIQGGHVDLGCYEFPTPTIVTIGDVVAVLHAAGGIWSATPESMTRLNPDKNGVIDLRDAVLLVRKLSGLSG